MITLYNTLSGTKEPLVPLHPGEVRIYVCGPTPYAEAHVGHARPAVVWDVLKRHFRYRGLQVRHVQNFTDIDDKIIQRAREEGQDPAALAGRHIREYLAALDALGVEPADFYPRVTEHIPLIEAFIQGLVDRGYAYAAGGDVYFRVARKADYGKLSHRSPAELAAGARVAPEPNKEAPADFALWKASEADEPGWDSPWGRGRPGWHIECSAMSRAYLGDRFDLHGGGLDLIFPHHENEIAQSEALTGQPPVSIWVHNGLVTMDEVKMSKSLGNGVSLRELLARYPAHVLRTYLVSVHYRSPLAFSEEGLAAWGRAVERVARLWEEVAGARFGVSMPEEPWGEQLWTFPERMAAALDDDFNTPQALAELFELVRDGFRLLGELEGADNLTARSLLRRALSTANGIFGILPLQAREAAPGVPENGLARRLARWREEARQARNWELADAIRQQLEAAGWEVQDLPEGTRIRRRSSRPAEGADDGEAR
ncbi:MAG: cysteine--tRNA ligase [Firmicutes bacterium]|nr:cysteine--tRNA ligase [Bacillota bacterium]